MRAPFVAATSYKMTPTRISQRPLFRVQYRKLIEDTSPNGIYSANSETITFIPPLSVSEYLSYCCQQCGHQQEIKAEELNSIVGNAFRMAYATQLKNQSTCNEMKKALLHSQDHGVGTWSKLMTTPNKPIETAASSYRTSEGGSVGPQSKPNSIPGLRVFENSSSPGSNQSTPTSDESNSPTELNIYKRLLEKPPLIKRVPVNIKEILHEEGFPSTRPTPEGCISFQKETCTLSPNAKRKSSKTEVYALRNITRCDVPFSHKDKKTLPSENSCSSSDNDDCKTYKRHRHSSLQTKTSLPPPPPPLPPERADSLIKHKEENELKLAPWFQAGIPREITLEVLSHEPVGAFMVRESTTKSGCYALSLRVPREYHPRGIAHYLIIRTGKGYKIKGFTKEFSTLTALITHHSVMQELLPCPLSLNRYNPSFTKSDTSKDFEDIDSDPDYNTLADFRKMMADLNV
ncbi:EGFR adapter protein-like isoform X2 [Planococcus citri]|uniref:EGFR adapter protein-like isoform X2 n=1 Tax=Planococcus citri TaxID=170843 RepID=UPI0031FA1335